MVESRMFTNFSRSLNTYLNQTLTTLAKRQAGILGDSDSLFDSEMHKLWCPIHYLDNWAAKLDNVQRAVD